MIVCTNHSDRKAYAKGLCKSCYNCKLISSDPEKAKQAKDYHTARYAQNPDAKKAQSSAWAAANKARKLAVGAAYRAANRDALNEAIRACKRRNPAAVKANNAYRRARKLQATPKWADRAAIKDVYLEADYFQMHVDHIVPLIHPLVCGLHVWDNLQLLAPEANLRKNNRFDPETYHAS